MKEEWKEILTFPKYSVSNYGQICREPSGRLMSIYANQYGVACVGLMRGRKQHHRSVPLLVARAFIPRHLNWDTPINLDGDRFNNRVDNLVWRPRSFAIAYNRQFLHPYPYGIQQPIRDKKTGEVYSTSWECAITLGLLESDLVLSILNNTYTRPTFQFFEVV